MSFAEELQILADLHASGSLSDEEFHQAKARLLNNVESDAPAERIAQKLEETQFHQKLERIDREWALKREDYYVRGRRGGRYIPTTGGSVFGVAVVVVIAFILFGLAAGTSADRGIYLGEGKNRIRMDPGGVNHGPPPAVGGAIAVFAVLILVFGVGAGLYGLSKAEGYQTAAADYEERRSKLLREQGESPPDDEGGGEIYFPESGNNNPEK